MRVCVRLDGTHVWWFPFGLDPTPNTGHVQPRRSRRRWAVAPRHFLPRGARVQAREGLGSRSQSRRVVGFDVPRSQDSHVFWFAAMIGLGVRRGLSSDVVSTRRDLGLLAQSDL